MNSVFIPRPGPHRDVAAGAASRHPGDLHDPALELRRFLPPLDRRSRRLLDRRTPAHRLDRAVQARLQTNKLRTQATQERLRRISEKQASLLKAKRTVPDGIKADIESAQKELAVFASDEKRLLAEIEDIKARAATDKKRFIELRGQDQ